MAEDEEANRTTLTPAQSAASAEALGDIIDTALAREAKARALSMSTRAPEVLEVAMAELARRCRDVIVQSPPNGADLGAILISYQFKEVLRRHGLAIVPEKPTALIRAAWKQGWFVDFYGRYRAMLRAAWTDESKRDTNAT
jgi:aryl-alcohol dehydrogenase-like predicted oxidoreductase